MSQYNLIAQAERLWLQLCSAHAQAEAEADISRRIRVERAREDAWWRLLRRLDLARKAVRLGFKKGGASWAALERRR